MTGGMVQMALEITHITRDDLQILRDFAAPRAEKSRKIGLARQPCSDRRPPATWAFHPAASGVAQWPGTRMELWEWKKKQMTKEW